MIITIGLFIINLSLIFLKAFNCIDIGWASVFMPIYIGIPFITVAKWVAWRLWDKEDLS